MIEIKDKSKCSGCHACFNICPNNCIDMKNDEEGFWYPEINVKECIDCNLCESVCPVINYKEPENNAIAYGCYNKNEKIRMESSSGGLFSAFCTYIIKNGGVVYGAKYDKSFNVIHGRTDSFTGLNEFMGSKYTQSKIGDIYSNVKKDLIDNPNKFVYFSGTPCQIDGLLHFLGKSYNNLICQDIICHGVPSPKIWSNYVKSLNNKFRDEPLKINFRSKRNGWSLFELQILYKNNSYQCFHGEDPYMRAFLSNICLRPSCYNCYSKSLHRNSDITLADFWGIDNINKSLNDDKGTSLVFINTTKGQELFNNIREDIVFQTVELEEAIKFNPSAYKSVSLKEKKRTTFFENYDKKSLDELVISINKTSLLKKLLKRCIKVIQH